MNLIQTTFMTSLLLAVALSPATASEKSPIAATELKSLMSGNSMAGNGKVKEPADPYDWIVFYDSDGTFTMRLKLAWGGGISTGEWWVSDKGELCNKFLTPPPGKESCWLMYREDAFYRFVPTTDKAVEGRAAIVTGNLLEK